MNLIDHISKITLFRGLPLNQLEAVARIAEENPWEKGKIIFSDNEQGMGFYAVIQGRVKIYKLASDGREQTLHILHPPEIFGEVPVFAGKNFPAWAETMEKSRILFFPRDAIISLIEKNPSIALNMLAELSIRLRRFTYLIDDLSLKEVPGRLAAYLLYTSEKGNESDMLELSITKGQLAGLLGTIPETLSRILTRMAVSGLIQTDGRRIQILNRDGLEELANGSVRL